MRKKGIWLVAAVALLALSAWLMSRGDKEKPTVRPPKIQFPRHAEQEDQERNQRRRTLPPLRTDGDEGFVRKRDPMLVALPNDPKRSVMVFEVDALKETPIMKVWLDCMLSRDSRQLRQAEKFKDRFGIDPMEDIERIAVSSDRVMLMQGSFEGARFDPEVWKKRTYGEKGVIYENQDNGRVVALWGDMMIAGEEDGSAEPVEDTIDRLESTDPNQKSLLNDWDSYGDVYGVLSPDDLAKMLPEEQAGLGDKIKTVVDRVDFHLDASDDVAMTADVSGPGGQDMEDLSKSFGAALAVGRIKAKNDGDEKLAQLLDYAKVKPQGGRFAVDVALPIDLLKDLGPCRKGRGDRAREDGDDPAPAATPAPSR